MIRTRSFNVFLLWITLNLFLLSGATHSLELSKQPVRFAKFWGPFSSLPIEKKINEKIPPELIDYLRRDNQANGWKNIPQPAVLSPGFLVDLRNAIAEIPSPIKNLIDAKLIGVFFVTDLGGTGYTEYVVDESGRQVGGFVVIDVSSINRTANEWATWKETSPFRADHEIQVKSVIEAKANDNRENALQYILLHEFGHIVSIGSPLLPKWGGSTRNLVIHKMKFFNLSWNIVHGKIRNKFAAEFPDLMHIPYYATEKNKLPGKLAFTLYRNLAETNFPTLYAATNPADDFAETFANYIHVVVLKKPWEVSVSSNSDSLVYKSCWAESRCDEKKALMEQLLARMIQ